MVMGLFIAKYVMRFREILDEQMVRMQDGAVLNGNPTLRTIQTLLAASPHRLLRGIAIQDRSQKWTFLVWSAEKMTHNQFYRNAQKSGFEIIEDIGMFFAADEETIEREAMASSLSYRGLDGLMVGFYPASEWSWNILSQNFPRVFAGTNQTDV